MKPGLPVFTTSLNLFWLSTILFVRKSEESIMMALVSSWDHARTRAAPSTVRGGTAPFIRHLPNGVRPRGSACFNSKFSHLVNQRSTRQSKPIGRSVLPSDQPVRSAQCVQDVLPIGVGKRP